jgi:hypothetical protein
MRFAQIADDASLDISWWDWSIDRILASAAAIIGVALEALLRIAG